MVKKRSLISTFAASAVGLVATMLSAPAQEPPIRIGFSMAQTGMLAQATPSQLNTYNLWKDGVNARGGLDIGGGKKRLIEFVQYDDQSRPDQAVRIYEKLITDDKVDLVLPPWGTPFHIALAPVLEKYKFPMVGNTAASVAVRKVKPGYVWFTTSAIPDKIGPELTAMAASNGVKSVAVINNVLPFTKELKAYLMPALKAANIEVKFEGEYPPDIKDMTSILTQIAQAKPDAVLALTYPSDSVLYAKQARELNIQAPFQFVAIGASDMPFRKAIGDPANGLVTIGHWAPSRSEWKGAKEFYDRYVQRFQAEPDFLNSALAWMSLEILEQAVAKAGLDKAKLRDAIAGGTFETINGTVKFDGVENTVTPTAFLQIQQGKLELVWPKSIATSQFQPKKGW
jgi:branched-chain amino acid transport system substrate-binding protein